LGSWMRWWGGVAWWIVREGSGARRAGGRLGVGGWRLGPGGLGRGLCGGGAGAGWGGWGAGGRRGAAGAGRRGGGGVGRRVARGGERWGVVGPAFARVGRWGDGGRSRCRSPRGAGCPPGRAGLALRWGWGGVGAVCSEPFEATDALPVGHRRVVGGLFHVGR